MTKLEIPPPAPSFLSLCLSQGENDPGRFGSTPVAVLTLFQVATLADWPVIYKTAYYGCDEYPGPYRRSRARRRGRG